MKNMRLFEKKTEITVTSLSDDIWQNIHDMVYSLKLFSL